MLYLSIFEFFYSVFPYSQNKRAEIEKKNSVVLYPIFIHNQVGTYILITLILKKKNYFRWHQICQRVHLEWLFLEQKWKKWIWMNCLVVLVDFLLKHQLIGVIFFNEIKKNYKYTYLVFSPRWFAYPFLDIRTFTPSQAKPRFRNWNFYCDIFENKWNDNM